MKERVGLEPRDLFERALRIGALTDDLELTGRCKRWSANGSSSTR